MVYAFLDINPIRPGHTLVVPKIEVDDFEQLPVEYNQAIWNVANRLTKTLKKTFACPKVWLSIVGLEVPHAHIHLIPIHSLQDVTLEATSATVEELENIQQHIIQEL